MERLFMVDLQINIEEVKANGYKFKCRTAGLESEGEPIIFLHGFPESSIIWENIMISFAKKGYRCIAPDLRGYSKEARPKGIKNYTVEKLAEDVIAIADAVGFKKFHLVGHDWGSACGWTVLTIYPERVNDWSALAVPHMAAYMNAKSNDKEQMEKSRYIRLFQVPVVPEVFLGSKNLAYLKTIWSEHSKREIEDYLGIFKDYEGRNRVINWYRANNKISVKYGDVTIPTLFIWGNKDLAIARAGVEDAKKYMKGEYNFVELDAGHWLVQEKYNLVLEEVSKHIRNHPIK
ncbi:alpha/beta hydrolase [Clostridium manihotivorum]|uniref:Alpha/beta hydrolase n=2 Tax=Clostridium manihotivorum TaxID=2320868 RepID=A0A3R5UIC6_9CLOT|nr:alpha/beta hydrolase [Clostridium manihotivorum]